MPPVLYTFGFLLLVLTRKVQSVSFQQSSPQVVKEGTVELTINCSHDDSSLQVMLWYQQKQSSRSMSLIGFVVLQGDPSYEDQFKESRFKIKGEGTGKGSLIIQTVTSTDSAVYFCAADNSGSYEAFFGGGTKLTVLEKDRKATRPLVKVLQPSDKECKNKRGNAEKTIVCVATRFYPDHVSVSWQVNGEDVSTGVATDNTAQREDKYYTITSRLRVSAKDWYNPNTEFKCTVSFYNGTDTEPFSDSIFGAKAKEGVLTREKYLKITQTAKLSYGVFIVKSMVYGVFVAFLVWKLQNSSGKRNH